MPDYSLHLQLCSIFFIVPSPSLSNPNLSQPNQIQIQTQTAPCKYEISNISNKRKLNPKPSPNLSALSFDLAASDSKWISDSGVVHEGEDVGDCHWSRWGVGETGRKVSILNWVTNQQPWGIMRLIIELLHQKTEDASFILSEKWMGVFN